MNALTLTQIGAGVAFLLLCLVATVQIATLTNIRRQQKREEEFATKAEIKRVDDKVDVVRTESRNEIAIFRAEVIRNGDVRRVAIETKVEEKAKEARADSAELRDKIDLVSTEVSEMRGETRMIQQTLARMEMKGHS